MFMNDHFTEFQEGFPHEDGTRVHASAKVFPHVCSIRFAPSGKSHRSMEANFQVKCKLRSANRGKERASISSQEVLKHDWIKLFLIATSTKLSVGFAITNRAKGGSEVSLSKQNLDAPHSLPKIEALAIDGLVLLTVGYSSKVDKTPQILILQIQVPSIFPSTDIKLLRRYWQIEM